MGNKVSKVYKASEASTATKLRKFPSGTRVIKSESKAGSNTNSIDNFGKQEEMVYRNMFQIPLTVETHREYVKPGGTDHFNRLLLNRKARQESEESLVTTADLKAYLVDPNSVTVEKVPEALRESLKRYYSVPNVVEFAQLQLDQERQYLAQWRKAAKA